MYFDAKMKLVTSVRAWASLSDEESLSCCFDGDDRFRYWDSDVLGPDIPVFSNGLLSDRARSPVLLEAIRLSVENILHERYWLPGEQAALERSHIVKALSLTGPVLLGYAAARSEQMTQVRVPCGMYGRSLGYFRETSSTPAVEADRQLGIGRIVELDQQQWKNMRKSGNDYASE